MTSIARTQRRRIRITGVIQGVGFRPFVHALATGLGLAGWVVNTGTGVIVEIEGAPAVLDGFEHRLHADAPPLAVIESVSTEPIELTGEIGFAIAESRATDGARALVPPDIATCDDCIAELLDPADRRHRHAFISCTNCGPRYTVIVGLPYDRPATTMADLPLCATCAGEYADPSNRRFHAQTIACPACGPQLRLHRPGYGRCCRRRGARGRQPAVGCGRDRRGKGHRRIPSGRRRDE